MNDTELQFDSESINRALRALDMDVEWVDDRPTPREAPQPSRDPLAEYDEAMRLLAKCFREQRERNPD